MIQKPGAPTAAKLDRVPGSKEGAYPDFMYSMCATPTPKSTRPMRPSVCSARLYA